MNLVELILKTYEFNWFYSSKYGWRKADGLIKSVNGMLVVENVECGLRVVHMADELVDIQFFDHTKEKKYKDVLNYE